MTECSRRILNFAPTPNFVSVSIAFFSCSIPCSFSSISGGRSNTDSFTLHAISTPTAYGITELRVAKTPPIGKP